MDKIRNEYIRGTAHMGRFGEKTRGGLDMYRVKMMVYWEKDAEDGTASKAETGKV